MDKRNISFCKMEYEHIFLILEDLYFRKTSLLFSKTKGSNLLAIRILNIVVNTLKLLRLY